MGAYGTVGTAPFQSIRQSHDLFFQKKKLAKETPQAKKKSLAEVVFSFSIIFPISQFKKTRFLAPKTKNMKGINWQCRAESAAAPSLAPMYACDHLINSNSAKSTSRIFGSTQE